MAESKRQGSLVREGGRRALGTGCPSNRPAAWPRAEEARGGARARRQFRLD